MQVLCKASMTASDVRCSVCGQGFVVYWERTSPAEQADARAMVQKQIAEHHLLGSGSGAHPTTGFNVPQWDGSPEFSAASLLGGGPERGV
ncbi:MAG TPA: hypothetical protein VGB94_03960 [Acidobacteriaceae bacterium]